MDFLQEVLAVCTGIFLYTVCERWYDSRKARRLDINCDNCEEAHPLAKIPNGTEYLCKNCMSAYLMEHEGEFTPEQLLKIKRSYRRRKKK